LKSRDTLAHISLRNTFQALLRPQQVCLRARFESLARPQAY